MKRQKEHLPESITRSLLKKQGLKVCLKQNLSLTAMVLNI